MGANVRDSFADHDESWLGLYGKLPSYGDFVEGGLPESFVQALDAWLSVAISGSRDRLGGSWKESYLASPPWRFGLDPGLASPFPVVGVLMPSIDSVGRCFPLVLAAAGRGDAVATAFLGAPWFDAIELLARRAIQQNMTKWDVLNALRETGAPTWSKVLKRTHVHRTPHATVWAGEGALMPGALARDALAIAVAGDRPKGFWWTKGSDRVTPAMLLCEAWPTPDLYAAFLSGTWQDKSSP